MEIIQTNKLAEIFDDKNIFFCKIDLIHSVIEKIKNVKNKCVLIVGNGDLPFTDELEREFPENVVGIYAQNSICNSDRVFPIPLGIGNSEPCPKSGHGEHWPDVFEKVETLKKIQFSELENLKIYSNFDVRTNPEHRNKVKFISQETDYVTTCFSKLSYQEYIDNILAHQFNLCPIGNGLDTHRVWETLYCYRVPIIFDVKYSRSYNWSRTETGIREKLYKKLPIVILDDENELKNLDVIRDKYFSVKKNWQNLNLFDHRFWVDKIYKNINF